MDKIQQSEKASTLSDAVICPYYQDSAVTIYHGDCREIVPTLGRIDLLLTDPPYLLPVMKGAGCFGGRASLTGTQGFTDMGFDSTMLEQFDNWFCFCSKHNLVDVISRTGSGKWALIHWCKPNPVPTCNNTYLSDVEYCVHRFSKGRLFGEMKDKSLFMVHPCGNKETLHPNEKPLALVKKCVVLGAKQGDTILDPFAGSCTTGRAAKDLGRKCVCIEREERYCEIGAKRMQQECFTFDVPTTTKQLIEPELF